MIHNEPSPLAGQVVKIADDVAVIGGMDFHVEDWWDRVGGGSWMDTGGNPACVDYAIRSGGHVPIDDEVLYGKVGMFGKLVHVSELAVEQPESVS